MRRLALLVEYDGTRFAGSQFQPGRATVQSELENAIEGLLGARARVALAGRTDAGVHARGQVAAFAAECSYETTEMRRALNARLPEDVAVRAVAEAPPGFDPRRDAVSRWYQYRVLLTPVRSPLARQRAWQVRGRLCLELVREALSELVGERDFASFAAKPAWRARTVRRMTRAEVRGGGGEMVFDFEATSFLPHQVRLMTGAVVAVGLRRLGMDEFRDLLVRPRTGMAGPMAPPQGLCLQRVTYEGLTFDVDEAPNTGDI